MATNKLLEIIEEKLTKNGAFRDCHHPEMIVWQATQSPSRSMYLEGRGESFIDSYIEIARKLESIGATKLCMSCNTAHYAFDEISSSIKIPFINLIKEVVLKAKETGVKKFGLCASDGALLGKVYEKQFQKYFPEAKLVYPNIDVQKLVTKGICNAKNNARFLPITHNDNPNYIFNYVCDYLIKNGADSIIIGCTDIRAVYYDPQMIDSLEVLSNTILEGRTEYE